MHGRARRCFGTNSHQHTFFGQRQQMANQHESKAMKMVPWRRCASRISIFLSAAQTSYSILDGPAQFCRRGGATGRPLVQQRVQLDDAKGDTALSPHMCARDRQRGGSSGNSGCQREGCGILHGVRCCEPLLISVWSTAYDFGRRVRRVGAAVIAGLPKIGPSVSSYEYAQSGGRASQQKKVVPVVYLKRRHRNY